MIKFYFNYLLLFAVVIFSVHSGNAQTSVTAAAAVNNLCVGGSSVTVGTITISEGVVGDFASGNGQTYIISAPANFEFDPTAIPALSETGNGITLIGAPVPTTTTFTITYDVSVGSTSGGPLDKIIINGLKVKAITAPATGNILMTAGTAVQTGNAVADAQNHCSLTSGADVSVTSDPGNQSLCNPATVDFAITATGGNLVYKWLVNIGAGYVDATTVSGHSNENTNTITNFTPTGDNGYLYKCVVSGCGVNDTSNAATLTNHAVVPNISAQPANKTICPGNTNTFTITATGVDSYQWQENTGSGYSNISNGGVYSGATTNTLTLTGVTSGMNGYLYKCVLTNTCGTTPSSAGTLTSLDVSVTSDPSNQNLCNPGSVNFGITATGGNLVYKWLVNTGAGYIDATIPPNHTNENTNTITNSSPNSGNGYLYKCVVSGCGLNDTSNAATLTAYAAVPNIGSQAVNRSLCAGGTTTFGIVATGVASYQWQENISGYSNISDGGVYSGATTTTLTLTGIPIGMDGRSYKCVLTNTCGTTTSTAKTLTVTSGATFFGLDAQYCVNAAKDTLEGFPVGGVFSGSGMGATNGAGKAVFDPSAATVGGPYTINYTYVGCIISKTSTVRDTSSITITNPSLSTYNTTDPAVSIITQTGGVSVTSVCTGIGVSGTNFYPSIAGQGGPYVISAAYTNTYGCLTSATKSVSVVDPSTAIPSLAGGICSNSGKILLDDNSVPSHPTFGTAWTDGNYVFSGYSGSGINYLGGNIYEFDPKNVTAGTPFQVNYLVTYYYYGWYYDYWTGYYYQNSYLTEYPFVYASQSVIVDQAPTVTFNLPATICKSVSTLPLATLVSPALGSGAVGTGFYLISGTSSNPLSGLGNQTFTPGVITNAQDTYSIKYVFISSSTGCKDSITQSITVFDKPTPPVVSTIYSPQNSVYCMGDYTNYMVVDYYPTYDYVNYNYNWYTDVALTAQISTSFFIFPPVATNAPTVSAGIDYYVTRSVPGAGCASDALVFNFKVNDRAIVDANIDQTVCGSNTATLAASSKYVTALTNLPGNWTVGTVANFSDTTSLTSTYTPDASDIAAGYVNLVFTSDDPDGSGPCPVAWDDIRITINPVPLVNAGADTTLCSSASVQLSASLSGSASGVTWSGGTDAFTNKYLSQTKYIANTAEKASITPVIFTATTNDPDGSGPCVAASDLVSVTFSDQASVNAGPAQTICSGTTATLAGTSKKLNSVAPLSATWYSPTSGAFTPDANTLSAVYTPTTADSANGYVDLVLKSIDPDGLLLPCPIDTQVVRITINQAAKVYAGPDVTYCSNNLITLAGITSGSASSLTWSGGGGTIASPTFLQTLYTATTNEKKGSTVQFTATTNDPDGAGPCLAVNDKVDIKINEEAFVNAGIDKSLCRSKTATVFNLNGLSEYAYNHTVLGATWSGGSGPFGNSSSLTSTYTPGVTEIPADGTFNKQVTLYLTSSDPDGVGGPCLAVQDSMILTVNPLPDVQSVIVPADEFCKTPIASSFLLNAVVVTNYGGSGIYSDTTTAANGVIGNSFYPAVAGVGQHRIYHIYTDGNTCKNNHDTLVNVYGIPRPKFTIAEYCATKPTYFNANSSDVIDFSTSGIDPNSTITSYSWIFGNNYSITDTSTVSVTNYIYDKTLDPSAKQTFTVSLKLGTDHGCFAQKDSLITIGNIPSSNFSWSKICPADAATLFKDISLFPSVEVNKYTWDFGDGTAIQSGPGMVSGSPNTADKNPSHKMANGTGIYDVKFKISTNIGCADSITHKVNILDEYTPTVTNPYSRNFASSDGFWSVDGQNPSWQWGSSNKTNISTGTRNVWITNTVGPYNVSEKSYLNGPCLNFSGLARPMISLKINSATQNQIAGAVLQSSIDGGATWNVVGAMGSGVNWYDNFGVLGNPGNQTVNQFAWTGTYPNWENSKINLNNLVGNTSVRLRIAFGSGQDTLNLKDGFALDSIWVGERDKLLLVENFTNSSTSTVIASDTKMNTLVNSRPNDLVAIHYHTGFPGSDPMNLRNQADPSSRVLHYGVPKVPYVVFDGNYDYGDTLRNANVDRRSLDPARFKLKLGTNITSTGVNVTARIIATDSISNNFVLHAAVVERNVTAVTGSNSQTNFEWVATRMLPDAGGTFFSQDFNKNDSVDVNLHWDYFATDVYDQNQLGVVVFVQDVATKEVYQAAYNQPGYSGTITTGLKNQLLAGKQLFVYPNPSSNATSIIFEEALDEDMEYTLQNELGQVVDRGVVLKGATQFPINTSEIPGGMYVVKVGNDKDGVAFKKIIVAH